MPRLKHCPICNAVVVTALTSKGVPKKGICSSIENARSLDGNHYVYQYPMEIIYLDNMSFWSNLREKKTYIYVTKFPLTANLVMTKSLYTAKDCFAFHKRFTKALVLT